MGARGHRALLEHGPVDSFLTWWVPMAKPTPALRHSSLLHPLQKSLTTANLSIKVDLYQQEVFH